MVFNKLCALLMIFGVLVFEKGNAKDYTTLKKPAFTIIGIGVKTSNNHDRGPSDISKLWERFITENIADKIPNKVSNDVVALYCDYEGDFTQPYTLVIGCPVNSTIRIPEGMVFKNVPESTYAVYSAFGEFPKCIIETWVKVWKSNLARTYTGDFELYGEKFLKGDPKEVEVLIAIEP
jgi:predicted transcriptional regulator YdeE